MASASPPPPPTSSAERQLVQLASIVGDHVQQSRVAVIGMKQAVLESQRAFAADVERLQGEVGNVQSSLDSLEMDLHSAVVERDMATAASMLPASPGTANLNTTTANTTLHQRPEGFNLTSTAASGTLRVAAAAAAAAAAQGGHVSSTPFGGTIGSNPMQTPHGGVGQLPPAAFGQPVRYTANNNNNGHGGDVHAAFEHAADATLLQDQAGKLHSILAAGLASPHVSNVSHGLRVAFERDGCGSVAGPRPAPPKPHHQPHRPPGHSPDTSDDGEDVDDRQPVESRHADSSPIELAIVAVRRAASLLSILLGAEVVGEHEMLSEAEETELRPVVTQWLQERLQQLRKAGGGSSRTLSPRAGGLSPTVAGGMGSSASFALHAELDPRAGLRVVGQTKAGAKPVRAGRLVQRAGGGRGQMEPGGANMQVASLRSPSRAPSQRQGQQYHCADEGDVAEVDHPELQHTGMSLGPLKLSRAITQGHYARLGGDFIHRHVAAEKVAMSTRTPSPRQALLVSAVSQHAPGGSSAPPRLPKLARTPAPAPSSHYESLISATKDTLKQKVNRPTAHLKQEVRVVQHTASLLGAAGKGLRQQANDERRDEAMLLVPTSANTAGTINSTEHISRVGVEAEAAANTPEAIAAAAAAAEAEARRIAERKQQLGVAVVQERSSQPFFDGVGKGVQSALPANRILARRIQASADFVVDEERAMNRQRIVAKQEKKRRTDIAPNTREHNRV